MCVLSARSAPKRNFSENPAGSFRERHSDATEGRHLGIFSILIAEMKALIEPDIVFVVVDIRVKSHTLPLISA